MSAAARRIAIGADHGGFELKTRLIRHLEGAGHRVEDVGTSSTEAVDYPVFASAVAQAVASGRTEVGIMIDGAGIGSSMVANKVPGVRAALAYDLSSARNSREHNAANVLTLGAGLHRAGSRGPDRRRLAGDGMHRGAPSATRGDVPRARQARAA